MENTTTGITVPQENGSTDLTETIRNNEGKILYINYKNGVGKLIRQEFFYENGFAKDIYYNDDKITKVENWILEPNNDGWKTHGDSIEYNDNGIVNHFIYSHGLIIKILYRNGQMIL
jgi:hypothetical protein